MGVLIRVFFSSLKKGRIPLDSVEWLRLRTFILLRDNFRCTRCGWTPTNRNEFYGRLDVHHIVPISRGGSNKLSNLTTLCRTCHRREHDWI